MPEEANSNFDPQIFLSTGNGGRTLSNYAKDDVIFSQGDAADAVFYIQSGKVKIVVTSEQGKEAVVGIVGPAEFFGEGCLIAQPVRLAMAVAMTESTIMRLDNRAVKGPLPRELSLPLARALLVPD